MDKRDCNQGGIIPSQTRGERGTVLREERADFRRDAEA